MLLMQATPKAMPEGSVAAIERHLKALVDSGQPGTAQVLKELEVSVSLARQVVEAKISQ